MQNEPLNLAFALEHAAQVHGQTEIITRRVEDGALHRYTYADALSRCKRLANGLRKLGVRHGDRIGTLGWNTYRHLEAWYAIAGQGGICHTINPRLFDDQIEYIINHAGDRVLLVDGCFLPVLERIHERLNTVEHYIVFTDEQHLPTTTLTPVIAYESLIESETDQYEWPSFSEDTPSSLCYTSGTTGMPKGVLYTHRSNLLHAFAVNSKNAIGISCSDTVLMVVPMFHANSWGLAYACPMVGATLVLPGGQMDGPGIYQLLREENVTLSAAVPTIWNVLLTHLRQEKLSVPDLKEVVIGGSAVPRSMIEVFSREFEVEVIQGWGMTEMSPLGTVCRLKPFMQRLGLEEQLDVRVKQGYTVFGIEMKIVDEAGTELPRDGISVGRLLVKGPWIVKRYFKEEHDAVDADGWFDTGDIASIDEHGYMQITDRAKDLIKSGGEWISSVDLENIALSHPDVELAAVIGVYHSKWEERPLLIVKAAQCSELTKDNLLDYMRDKVAKWWLPDDVVFVDEIPLTATGKLSKLTLREQFRKHRLPTDESG